MQSKLDSRRIAKASAAVETHQNHLMYWLVKQLRGVATLKHLQKMDGPECQNHIPGEFPQ
jgi:hypothetical protein